jgi:hypothetical protein
MLVVYCGGKKVRVRNKEEVVRFRSKFVHREGKMGVERGVESVYLRESMCVSPTAIASEQYIEAERVLSSK